MLEVVEIAPVRLPTCLTSREGQGMGLSSVSIKKDRKTELNSVLEEKQKLYLILLGLY